MSRKTPSVEINNYTSIFTGSVGEWYKNVGYEDSLDFIRDNFIKARKSFVEIGYYLKHIKEGELYKEGGYQNIWECAEGEFGLSAPAASNYMKMNDAYSVNGNTPILDEKYNGFNKSQLQEMLALTDKRREEIRPEQTVREIRGIAKEEKRLAEPSEKEIRQYYEEYIKKIDSEPRTTLKERLREKYKNAGGCSSSFQWSGSARGIRINQLNEITWAQLVKLVARYYPEKQRNRMEEGEEEQLPGQMKIGDYPGVMPDKKKSDPASECPPGIGQCIRQEWGITSKQQETGKEECLECWGKWRMGILHGLLERACAEGDERTVSVLKWAIFALENIGLN